MHVTADMLAAVGTVFRRRRSYPVSESDIRRWAIAVYYPEAPPARFLGTPRSPTTRLTAPAEFNPFAWSAAEDSGDDGRDPGNVERMLGIPAPPLTHQLNGGLDAEYLSPICAGDTISSTNTLTEYFEREGRLGQMLFTITVDVWTNQDDRMVKSLRRVGIRYL